MVIAVLMTAYAFTPAQQYQAGEGTHPNYPGTVHMTAKNALGDSDFKCLSWSCEDDKPFKGELTGVIYSDRLHAMLGVR